MPLKPEQFLFCSPTQPCSGSPLRSPLPPRYRGRGAVVDFDYYLSPGGRRRPCRGGGALPMTDSRLTVQHDCSHTPSRALVCRLGHVCCPCLCLNQISRAARRQQPLTLILTLTLTLTQSAKNSGRIQREVASTDGWFLHSDPSGPFLGPCTTAWDPNPNPNPNPNPLSLYLLHENGGFS